MTFDQCFCCEETPQEEMIEMIIYSHTPSKQIYFCRECFNDMGQLNLTFFLRQVNNSNCSICKQTILVREWTSSEPSAHPKVFVDIYHPSINDYYRICKSCFDRDIGYFYDTI